MDTPGSPHTHKESSILIMDDNDVVKKVLVERVKKFCDNTDTTALNRHRSPVFEMLLAANRLNILDEVISFVAGTKVWSKLAWKELTWKKRMGDKRCN